MSKTLLSVSSFKSTAAGSTSDTPGPTAVSVLDGIIFTIDQKREVEFQGAVFGILHQVLFSSATERLIWN
jgi:hypothetical protein